MSTRPAILLVAILSSGCNRDWDLYDPRLGTTGPGAGGGSSSSSGMGGQSSSSSSASGSGGAGGSLGMGGSGGSPCAASLQDDFNDGTIETATTWEAIEDNVTLSETNGNLVIAMPAGSSQKSYGELRSRQVYDLSGCGVSVQVREVPNPDTEAYIALVLRAGDVDYLETALSQNGLQFKKVIANTHLYLKSIQYDPAQHAYWRIREEGGSSYWDTSPDGKQWTNWASETNSLPVTAMKVGISTGIEMGVPDPGHGVFDNLGVAP